MSDEAFVCPVDLQGDRAILRPVGDIDLEAAPRLKDLSSDLIEKGARKLAFDLSRVGFMDSSGLGALVVGLKRIRDQNGCLCLFAVNQRVKDLLSLTGLDAVFHVEPDEAAALRFLGA